MPKSLQFFTKNAIFFSLRFGAINLIGKKKLLEIQGEGNYASKSWSPLAIWGLGGG